jgi:hypothetical protein
MFFALALPALVHGWTGPPRLGREQGQHYWLLRPAGGGDLYGVPKATEQGQVLARSRCGDRDQRRSGTGARPGALRTAPCGYRKSRRWVEISGGSPTGPKATKRSALRLRSLQRGVDGAERGAEGATNAVDRTNDSQRNTGRDQAVFNGGRAGFVIQKTRQNLGHFKPQVSEGWTLTATNCSRVKLIAKKLRKKVHALAPRMTKTGLAAFILAAIP